MGIYQLNAYVWELYVLVLVNNEHHFPVETWAFGRMRKSTSVASRHYKVFVSINHDVMECPFSVAWIQNHIEFICSTFFGKVSATFVNWGRLKASNEEAQ